MSNELDKRISDKLRGYESEVDAEALWMAVRPPRRRRPFFWLFLLGGIILLGGGAWWYSHSQNEERISETIVDTHAGHPKADSETSSNLDENRTQTHSGSETIVQQAATANTRAFIDEENAVSRRNAGQQLLGIQTKVISEKRLDRNDDESQGILIGNKQLEDQLLVIETVDEFAATDIDIDERAIYTGSAKTVLPTLEEREQVQSASDRLDVIVPDYLPLPVSSLVYEAKPLSVLSESDRSVRNKKSPWFLQSDFGCFQLNRNLSSGDSISSWVENRIATERTLEGFSVDFGAGYKLKKGWQIRAGLGYSQLNTVFSRALVTETVDTVIGVRILVHLPDNSVDTIMGPVAYYETIRRDKKTYNSFREWEIPVLLGYNFEIGKIDLLLEGGIRLRLKRTAEGTILNSDANGFVALSEVDWYRTGIGYSLQAGVQLALPVTPRLKVLLGGSMRYYPVDFTTTDAVVQERYQMMGAQLGVQYKLN